MKNELTTAGAFLRLSLLFAAVAVAARWGFTPGAVSLTVALGAFTA